MGLKMKLLFSVLLLMIDVMLLKISSAVNMTVSGKLAINQFDNSDISYILLQNGTDFLNGYVIFINIVCLGFLILIWKNDIKNLFKGEK
jgi:hypothetical protein